MYYLKSSLLENQCSRRQRYISHIASRAIEKYRRIKRTMFSTRLAYVPLVNKYEDRLTTQISHLKNGIFEEYLKPILKDFRAQY